MEHTSLSTDSAPFTTVISCLSLSDSVLTSRGRRGHVPGSHTQSCWLGIQLDYCTTRGARCWSEIRLRRVVYTAPGTGSVLFMTMIDCQSRSTEPRPVVGASGMPMTHTTRSHAQPCWLGIQLYSCATRGVRCWSERLRRVEYTATDTDSDLFTTILPLPLPWGVYD